MAGNQLRMAGNVSRHLLTTRRTFTTSIARFEANLPTTKKQDPSAVVPEDSLNSANSAQPVKQAPNRVGIWSRSQQPRTKAMTGPRFEQTDFDHQVTNLQGKIKDIGWAWLT